jgi:myosin heavy subunit
MSVLGKISAVIAIVASIAAAILGFIVVTEKANWGTQLADVEARLKAAPGGIISYTSNFRDNTNEPAATLGRFNIEVKNLQENLATTQNTLKEKEDLLTKSQVEVANLTEKGTRLTQELEKTKSELDDTKAALVPLQNQLKEIQEALGGQDAKEIVAAFDKTKEDLKTIQDQLKTVEFENRTLVAQVNKLTDLQNLRDKREAPPELTGRVVAINRAWNFVVLDVGTDKRLVDGVDLTVYRGNEMIGKIRTVSVDAKMAVADILPDWSRGEIQVGDQVLF